MRTSPVSRCAPQRAPPRRRLGRWRIIASTMISLGCGRRSLAQSHTRSMVSPRFPPAVTPGRWDSVVHSCATMMVSGGRRPMLSGRRMLRLSRNSITVAGSETALTSIVARRKTRHNHRHQLPLVCHKAEKLGGVSANETVIPESSSQRQPLPQAIRQLDAIVLAAILLVDLEHVGEVEARRWLSCGGMCAR